MARMKIDLKKYADKLKPVIISESKKVTESFLSFELAKMASQIDDK